MELVNAKRRRRTPTEKQIEQLGLLSYDELLDKALASMHALNRRAKQYRDTSNEYRRAYFRKAVIAKRDEIYSLKDLFLTALLRSGKAIACSFSVEERDRYAHCPQCERCWIGSSWCYECDDDTGEYSVVAKRWHIVRSGDYSFHSPDLVIPDGVPVIEIEPHDPTQEAKPIPKIGLTIQAQFACVRMFVEKQNEFKKVA